GSHCPSTHRVAPGAVASVPPLKTVVSSQRTVFLYDADLIEVMATPLHFDRRPTTAIFIDHGWRIAAWTIPFR
ncbi:MAG: hypothetical protein M3380_06055, partial [Chloroflexota bacterium]|nr:hypothetical protein [Chloroflexota bacterium]